MNSYRLKKVNDEDVHVITGFSCVTKPYNGVRVEYSLNDLHRSFQSYVAGSKQVIAKDDDEIYRIKREDLKVIVYADLKNDYRSKKNFLSQSLICLDIDYKEGGENVMSYDDMVNHLKTNDIDSVIHTSLRHTNTIPRYRVIINIGKLCDQNEMVNYTKWFSNTLACKSAVDPKSWVISQCMILPCAYMFVKPRLDRIVGKSLHELFDPQYQKYVSALPKATATKPRTTKQSYGKASTAAEDLFIKQVSLLHKPLILNMFTNTSIQFFRNTNDNNAGLFCLNHQKVIHDKSKKHNLFYSLDDYSEAKSHKLPSRQEIADRLLCWESDDSKGYAVLHENCGSGKSQSIQKLAVLDPAIQKRMFTFHMRKARNRFHEQSNNCVLIYGNIELIEQSVTDSERFYKIRKFLKKYYDSITDETNKAKKLTNSNKKYKQRIGEEHLQQLENDMYFSKVLKELQDNHLITDDEKKEITKRVKDNRNLINSGSHLVMTTAKLEYMVSFSIEDAYKDFVIYTDEVIAGMLTHIPDNTKVTVYRNCEQNITPESSLDYEKIRNLKRCLLTAEKVIVHELNNLKMSYELISSPSKTYDENFEVVIVPSTSNKASKNSRQLIYETIRTSTERTTPIIVDGIDGDENTYNHTNSKGINSLSEANVIEIISYPSPKELAMTMYVTGLDERTAEALIMSDKATQAIGRNQGFRNKDGNGNPSKGNNYNLLVLPDKEGIELHNITTKVTRVSQWHCTDRLKALSIPDKRSFHFSNVIDNLASVTKYSNQSDQLTMDQQYANVLYIMLCKVAEHDAKRISLKELEGNSGIKKRTIKLLFKDKYEIRSCRAWNSTGDLKLDSIYFR